MNVKESEKKSKKEKKEATIGISIEMEKRIQLQKLAAKATIDEGKTYTVPEYIRSKLIDPHLNGHQAPTIPKSVPKNVSPVSKDTDSTLSEEWSEFADKF